MVEIYSLELFESGFTLGYEYITYNSIAPCLFMKFSFIIDMTAMNITNPYVLHQDRSAKLLM